MNTILIILGTMMFDLGAGLLISYNKKKQLKRDEDLFIFKVEQLLENGSIPLAERISKTKDLCRRTEGKTAYGVYFALDRLNLKQ